MNEIEISVIEKELSDVRNLLNEYPMPECPICKTFTLESSEFFKNDLVDKCIVYVQCTKCLSEWTEVFKFIGVEDVDFYKMKNIHND